MSENTTSKPTSEPKVLQPVLRKVDLNLLTILILSCRNKA